MIKRIKIKIIAGLILIGLTNSPKTVLASEWTNVIYQAPFDIVLPNNYTNENLRFPVLYLLHGRNQNYSVWRNYSVLAAEMEKTNRNFIVVLPDSGGNSWYQKLDKIQYFRTDLPTYIEQNFRASKIRGIGGLSMGGYGAFHLSWQSDTVYVKDYKAVSSMSGAFIEPGESDFLDGIRIDSPNTLAQNIAGKPFDIYMDCGEDDVFGGWIINYSLKNKNEEMKDLLVGYERKLNTNLFFFLPPGEHNWDYWNSRIPYHLNFHNRRFNKYPMLSVTSFPENIETAVDTNIALVAGLCYSDSTITEFTYKTEATDKIIKGNVTGSSNWYFNTELKVGKNNIRINVLTSNDFNTFARFVLFRRNKSFRVRKVIVREKSIVAKISDVTYGDINALTNGMDGTGYFRFGNIILPITNLWKRNSKYVVKYKDNNDDYKFTIKTNGKAQKDFTLLNFKWKNKSLMKTNLLDFVTLNSNNLLEIQFGFYGDGTNIFLEEKNDGKKGKFKWNGKWFE